MSEHFVYLIAGGSFVKIGHARDPRSRLHQLSSGSPFALSIHHTWALSDRAAAVRMESRLHVAFDEVRANGEWFKMEARWAKAVGDAWLQGDEPRADELLEIFESILRARDIVEDFEDDGDEEEADLWRTIGKAYEARALETGLPAKPTDTTLNSWRQAA